MWMAGKLILQSFAEDGRGSGFAVRSSTLDENAIRLELLDSESGGAMESFFAIQIMFAG